MSGSRKIIKSGEKRRAQRLNIPIKVKYKLFRKKRILEEIFTQNISGSGIGIKASKLLVKGSKIRTLLQFPGDSTPIAAVGEVMWCKKVGIKNKPCYDTGIKHIRIIPKDRERFVFLFCEMMINFLTLRNNSGFKT